MPVLFWIIKDNTHSGVRLVDCDEFTVLHSCCVYVDFFSFFFLPLDHIRLTLRLNVGTWETLPGPSVTLQMALRVKVGHGETLSSTRYRTIEITGV